MAWGKEILRSKVVVGAHHLDTQGSGDTRVTEHSIKKAKYHIHYNKDTTDADVAVIELREPIEFRANAVPVCLPEETEEFLEEKATVIGWGRLQEYGESSRVLREVSVKIISNEVCSYMYQPIEVTGNMLCAGDAKGGKDACQGDSGGSLNVNMVRIHFYRVIILVIICYLRLMVNGNKWESFLGVADAVYPNTLESTRALPSLGTGSTDMGT